MAVLGAGRKAVSRAVRNTKLGPDLTKLKGPAQVNIGMNVGDELGLTPEQVVSALEAQGVKVKRAMVVTPEHAPGTANQVYEPTVVAVLDKPLSPKQANQVAQDLGQQAIAQRVGPSNNFQGGLYGPERMSWDGGQFNPDYFVDYNSWGKRNRVSGDPGPLPHLAERYPETAPPVRTYDANKRSWHDAKDRSPEEEALLARRQAATQGMLDEGYEPYFPLDEMKDVPEGTFPPMGDETLDIIPKTPRGQATTSWMLDAPEVVQRLKEGWERQGGNPNAVNWYHVGQLLDEYQNVYGPAEGAARFKREFADSMAATAAGNDPTQNLLLAQYGRWLENEGLPTPPSHQVPTPVGGRRTANNLASYDRIIREGGGIQPESAPKMYDFSGAYQGNPNRTPMDEQMSSMWGMSAPPSGSYGYAAQTVRNVADELGVEPRGLQAANWFDIKQQDPAPMMQVINETVERTARVTGMSPEEVVRRGLVRGEIPLYAQGGAAVGTGLAAGAGVLASPDEAEAAGIGAGARGAARGGARAARRRVSGGYNPNTEFGAADAAIKVARDNAGKVVGGVMDPSRGLASIQKEMGLVQSMAKLGRITPEQATRSMDELFRHYQRAQQFEMERGGRLWSQYDIPAAPEGSGLPTSADNIGIRQGLANDVPTAGAGGVPEGAGSELTPYRVQREPTPQEAAEVGYWEGLEREISRAPEGYMNRPEPPAFVDDLMRYGDLERDPGRVLSPSEVQAFERDRRWGDTPMFLREQAGLTGREAVEAGQPAALLETQAGLPIPPEKKVYDVAGAAGAAAAIQAGTDDPGLLAGPTMRDEGGRVTPRRGVLDAWSDSRASWADSQAERRAELEVDPLGRVKALPGFLGGVGRHYAGMIAGGLGAAYEGARSALGHEIGRVLAPAVGGEAVHPADIEELVGIVESARDRWGTIDDENQIVQDIGQWMMERPWLLDAIGAAGQVYNRGADAADKEGAEAGVAYRTILEGFLELL